VLTEYNSEDVQLMGQVCDDAWATLKTVEPHYPVSELDARATMAIRVMQAVSKGERDPEVLKAIALALTVAR
jgi:hypothetical protein